MDKCCEGFDLCINKTISWVTCIENKHLKSYFNTGREDDNCYMSSCSHNINGHCLLDYNDADC
jgi:hypothetical protein